MAIDWTTAGLAGGGAAGSIIGGIMQADAIKSAAKRADKRSRDFYNQGRTDVNDNLNLAQQVLAPYAKAGIGAGSTLQQGLATGQQLQLESAPVRTPEMSEKQWRKAVKGWQERVTAQARGAGITLPNTKDSAVLAQFIDRNNQTAAQVAAPGGDPNWTENLAGPGNLLRNYTWGDYAKVNGGRSMADDLRAFTMDDFQADPGYQFRLKQGTDGVMQSAAAKGMLHSGGTLAALDRYSQDFASNEYGKAHDRFTGNQDRNLANFYGMAGQIGGQQNDTFNRLNTTAGRGQSAAQTRSGNYMAAGSQLAGLATGQGSTSAGLAMTGGQATADMYGNIGNAVNSGIGGALFYDWLGNRGGATGNGTAGNGVSGFGAPGSTQSASDYVMANNGTYANWLRR